MGLTIRRRAQFGIFAMHAISSSSRPHQTTDDEDDDNNNDSVQKSVENIKRNNNNQKLMKPMPADIDTRHCGER